MPPTDANTSQTETHARCPLCGAPLENPDECGRCDWVKGYRSKSHGGTKRDKLACLMSVIPGAGHLYKGHKVAGALYLIGTVLAILWCTLAALPTMGMGLLLLPLYWAWVMTHAYWVEDRAVTGN